MVVIRLSRVGKKNSPAYRVVVADKQRAVKRKFIEIIGHYNPILVPKELVIDKTRAVFWLEKGAQASDTVNNLMVDLGILKKDQKIKKVYGKATKKKAIKDEKPEPVADEKVVAEDSTKTTPVAESTDDNANEKEAAAEVAGENDIAEELEDSKNNASKTTKSDVEDAEAK